MITAASTANMENQLAAGDVARERGGKVIALTIPQPPGVRLCFESGFVLDAMPGWETVMALPHADKMAILADPAPAAELERRRPGATTRCAAWPTGRPSASSTSSPRRTSSTWAARSARSPPSRAATPSTCSATSCWPTTCSPASGPTPRCRRDEDWKLRVDVWRDERAVIGASDAGAHLDLLATFNYSTVLLGEAVREQRLLPLEEAVHLITDVPAQLYGLVDRGRLEEGYHADVVVLDPATVDSDADRHALRPARRRRPPLRRRAGHRPRAGQRHAASSRRRAHRRPARHAAALGPRHPHPRDGLNHRLDASTPRAGSHPRTAGPAGADPATRGDAVPTGAARQLGWATRSTRLERSISGPVTGCT